MKKGLMLLVVILLVVVGYKFMKTEAPVEEVVEETVEEVVMTDLSTLEAGELTLDTETSVLKYTGKKLVGSHSGTVGLTSGSLTYDGENFTAGGFVVDMTTISEEAGSESFVKHVASEDFFKVEEFSESSFALTKVEQDEGVYTVTGDLTILDKTNEISFPAAVTLTEGVLGATASFTIDRTLWGVTYGSGSFFEDLGDNAIDNDIAFELSLNFK